MATFSVQSYDRSGLNPSYAAAAGGGDEFVNAGVEFIHVKNDDASSMDLTIVTQNTSDDLAVADRVISIPAGEERIIGPFPTGIYNDANGKVQLTYSSVTSLTVGVIKAA